MVRRINIVTCIFALGISMLFMYVIAYFLPITNQAVVSNSSINILSKNNGIIDKILVKNGQNINIGESILVIKNQDLENEYAIVKKQLEETNLLLSSIKSRIVILNSTLSKANFQLNNFQKIIINHDNDEGYSDIIDQIKIQQNIVLELQKQLGVSNTELIKTQTQIISYNNQLNIINNKLDMLTVRSENSGYIQDLDILQGSEIINNQKLFTIIHQENQKVVAYFSENDLQKIHENDKVLIFPRAYIGLHYEEGRVIAGNWGIPINLTDNVVNQNYLINSPKRIPVEIIITSKPNIKYPLNSGMSAYAYVAGK